MERKDYKTIVVGFTGRIDSVVSAFLLKKQGHKVIAVSLVVDDDTPVKEESDNDAISDSSTVKDEIVVPTCFLGNLQKVKEVADKLEIPFYGVDARQLYRERVKDFAISARLSGELFPTCLYCNTVKFEILTSKAELLGADLIATGHYAKVSYQKKNDNYFLATANDLENDQSYLLSTLGQEYLSKVIFPLAEMRKAEVERIASGLNIAYIKKEVSNDMCLVKDAHFGRVVAKNSSKSLRKMGAMFYAEDDVYLSDHTGFYRYYLGQSSLIGINNSAISSNLSIVKFEPSKGNILVESVDKYTCSFFSLRHVKITPCVNMSKPFSAYVKLEKNGLKFKAFIFFKSLGNIVVELETPIKMFVPKGTAVVVYSGDKINAKVLMMGEVDSATHFEELNRLMGPASKKHHDIDEDDENKKKGEIFTF